MMVASRTFVGVLHAVAGEEIAGVEQHQTPSGVLYGTRLTDIPPVDTLGADTAANMSVVVTAAKRLAAQFREAGRSDLVDSINLHHQAGLVP